MNPRRTPATTPDSGRGATGWRSPPGRYFADAKEEESSLEPRPLRFGAHLLGTRTLPLAEDCERDALNRGCALISLI
jgi:hypothetical protein